MKVISLRGADNFLRTITPTVELTIAFILMLTRNLKGAIEVCRGVQVGSKFIFWARAQLFDTRELSDMVV